MRQMHGLPSHTSGASIEPKGLFGLVQAGRTWNEELNGHMESVGYVAMEKATAVYVKGSWDRDDFVVVDFGTSLASVLVGNSTLWQGVWMWSTVSRV